MHLARPALMFTTAALIASGAFLAGAQAHEEGKAPKAGGVCEMSGTAVTSHSSTFICTTVGGKLVWGKGLPVSASPLKVTDAWTKVASSGMSATFGVVTNPTTKPITIVGSSSPYAPMDQLHEVVTVNGASVMQQKQGGFTIPAKSSLTLQPGGNHIMFMSLSKPVTAGAMVPVTLTTSTGAQVTFKAVGKVFSGGNETYNGATPMPSMSSMKM